MSKSWQGCVGDRFCSRVVPCRVCFTTRHPAEGPCVCCVLSSFVATVGGLGPSLLVLVCSKRSLAGLLCAGGLRRELCFARKEAGSERSDSSDTTRAWAAASTQRAAGHREASPSPAGFWVSHSP